MSPACSRFAVIWALSLTVVAFAQEPGAGSAEKHEPAPDVFSLDIDALLNVRVTTASKFSEKLSEAPGVMSVITRNELDRFGGITLQEILERIPGLSVSTAYFTDRSLMAARGDQTKINGGHILFLIDGRPTREILEGGLITDLLQSFPVNVLERIEVIKGPGSVLYGSNAFSAVVNLITKKADDKELVFTGLGSASGALATSAQGMFKRGNLGIVAATRFQEDDWTAKYRVADPLSGIPTASSISIPDGGPGAFLKLNYKDLNVTGSFTQSKSAVFFSGFTGQARWDRGFADLGYRRKATSIWDMSFNLTYTRNIFDASTFAPLAISRDSSETVLEWTNFVRVTDRDQLTLGTLYNYVQGRETYYAVNPPAPISDGSRSGTSSYAQLEHRLVDSVKLIGGFQINKLQSIQGEGFVPRIGAVWTPTSRIGVKTLYSTAYRAPSINETFLDHPVLKGNPDLKPERVSTADIGVSYQGSRFQGGIDYFRSKQTNSIVKSPGAPPWIYVNFGEATFHGAEAEGKYYLTNTILALGSVSYQANTDGDGNKNVTPIPNLSVKFGISYANPKKALTASLFEVSSGRMPGYAGALNPPPAADHDLAAHVRYDLSKYLTSYKNTGCAFVLHATNLANHKVWLPDWGDAVHDTIPVRQGRMIYLGLEFTLQGSR
jgi:outer membrane receptor for ferrienterochelin and colicins